MGSSNSKAKKPKLEDPNNDFPDASRVSTNCQNSKNDANCSKSSSSSVSVEKNKEPSFVLKRQGSMYLDEEGSLAHEFYEEVIPTNPGKRPYMKRQVKDLTPQGEVYYANPRLSGDCDIILCDS